LKIAGPKLLVTGFGPFPGAPENPTERLVRALAEEPAQVFGASAFEALVLPTEYARSWAMLRRTYRRFDPDVVIHFGLSGRAKAIDVETVARNRVATDKPDSAGLAPRAGYVRRGGPETLPATVPTDAILAALKGKGIAAQVSEDAGDYVCNATLYRSLRAAPAGRRVGFIHVPQPRRHFTGGDLLEAARIALLAALDRPSSS